MSAPVPASSPTTAPPVDAMWPQFGADVQPLRPAPRVGIPLDNEEYGLDCLVCGTRLHVRRTQIGQTLKCPDCHSPVLVKPPSKREQPKPVEEEEAEEFKLSEPVELPPAVYVPPGTLAEGTGLGGPPTMGTPSSPGSPLGGGTAMQNAARAMLEKAQAEQEAEEAEERERSAERFTQGLFAFLADRHALARLAILAVWLAIAMTLFHVATRTTQAEKLPTIGDQFSSLAAAVGGGLVGLSFLFALAACALALVQDTANGLWKIENWPGMNFIKWGLDVFYILNAGFLAVLPGAGVGLVLTCAGLPLVFPALATAAGFVLLFPPILLSMFESRSALAPASPTVWSSIRERPEPWKLTYLMTAVWTMVGLIGLAVTVWFDGGLPRLFAAVVMVACAMIYFRTVGRLACVLAGRHDPPKPAPEK